jgi:SAM-dependent methyltransferase
MREMFHYFACGECGAMQLTDPPTDLGRFYPREAYYSLATSSAAPRRRGVKGWLSYKRNEAVVFPGATRWGFLAKAWPWEELKRFQKYFRGIRHGSLRLRILDVGCGGGQLLLRFAELGFRRLMGVDPFVAGDSRPHPCVEIKRAEMKDMPSGAYDLVMLNDSLEHMADQRQAFEEISRLMAPGGVSRIEMPVAGCAAWEDYGVDWAELDAPRHYCLHTPASVERLARAAGMKVEEELQAGTSFEFWGSERYRRNEALYDKRLGRAVREDEVFSERERKEFAERVAAANAAGKGGRRVFVLRHGGQDGGKRAGP